MNIVSPSFARLTTLACLTPPSPLARVSPLHRPRWRGEDTSEDASSDPAGRFIPCVRGTGFDVSQGILRDLLSEKAINRDME